MSQDIRSVRGLFDESLGTTTGGDFYYLHLLFNILLFYFRLYGIHFIFISFLTGMTLFRKDISCNRVYSRNERWCPILGKTLKREDAERILDETSTCLSGGPWFLAIMDYLLFPVAKKLCLTSYNMVPSSDAYNHYIPFATDYGTHLASSMRHCYLTQILPVDAQIHILSLLPIKDIVSFSLVNRYTSELVHGAVDNVNASDNAYLRNSDLVWKSLIVRDFSHIISSKYMQIATNRFEKQNQPSSNNESNDTLSLVLSKREGLPQGMKAFYFEFQLSWLNFILAGHNTYQSCLVGIHGNALNVTDFIDHHPGSPETLLMHSGLDSTRYFTTLNHSKRAQSIALQKIVLRRPSCSGTLQKYQNWYNRECVKMETQANRYCPKDVVGPVHVYYNALECAWRSWYTSDQDFLPIFIEKV